MSRREKEIRIMVSQTEYQKISSNAKKLKMQVAPYLRKVAQNPVIEQIDYSVIAEHTNEIAEVRNSINHLIFTIEVTNNYLPHEIQSIVEMMNGIFESENKLLRTIREEKTRRYEKERTRSKKKL